MHYILLQSVCRQYKYQRFITNQLRAELETIKLGYYEGSQPCVYLYVYRIQRMCTILLVCGASSSARALFLCHSNHK